MQTAKLFLASSVPRVEFDWTSVGMEHQRFLRDASGNVRDKDLRADFMAIGVWERQRVAFFDNRILDAAAPSRFDRSTSYVTAMRAQ